MTALETNWQVITGAPCSGKTAVIDYLARHGFETVPEAARAYIDNQLASGLTIGRLKADIDSFEKAILARKQETEANLDPARLVFLDRGMPDSIAYFELEGLDPSCARKACGLFRYRNVFFFQRLPLRPDRVRREDEATAARLERLLLNAYLSLGYTPIIVPAMDIEARAGFILDKLDVSPAPGS